jgi:hypothetical protein
MIPEDYQKTFDELGKKWEKMPLQIKEKLLRNSNILIDAFNDFKWLVQLCSNWEEVEEVYLWLNENKTDDLTELKKVWNDTWPEKQVF